MIEIKRKYRGKNDDEWITRIYLNGKFIVSQKRTMGIVGNRFIDEYYIPERGILKEDWSYKAYLNGVEVKYHFITRLRQSFSFLLANSDRSFTDFNNEASL